MLNSKEYMMLKMMGFKYYSRINSSYIKRLYEMVTELNQHNISFSFIQDPHFYVVTFKKDGVLCAIEKTTFGKGGLRYTNFMTGNCARSLEKL